MKVKFKTITNPDDPGQVYLMGMAFVKGKHRMTGVPFKDCDDEKAAKKLIRKAFAKYQSE